MTLLVIGVLVWSATHLVPSVTPGIRGNLVGRLGEKPYRGLFALIILIALTLIVLGWRSAELQALYTPPLYGSVFITVLMFISFLLFAAANAPGNIKRILRHPMLTGTIVWSAAHLLANGDNRSVVLFGGIGLWALISIVTINRREGPWTRPAAVSPTKDAMTVVGTAVIFAIVLYLHHLVLGVSALPGVSLL